MPPLSRELFLQALHGRHECMALFFCVRVVSVHVTEELPGVMGHHPQNVQEPFIPLRVDGQFLGAEFIQAPADENG